MIPKASAVRDRRSDRGPDRRKPPTSGSPIGHLVAVGRVRLQRLFAVFLLNFLGVFYFVRLVMWPRLEADLLARGAEIVALTPFDVILLQAKLATIGGIVLTVPILIVLVRTSIGERGTRAWLRRRWHVVLGTCALAIALFAGGVLYAYGVIFPFLFDFLAANAIQSGFTPTYSIVHWTQFVLTLVLVMGVAAELPLVMTSLVYAELVSYETFRKRWKVAVFGVVVLSSIVNGSPDPFSMLLVAVPLVVLYGVGLGCARLVVTARESGRLPERASPATDATESGPEGRNGDGTAAMADDRRSSRLAETIERTSVTVSEALATAQTNEEIGGYYYDLQYVVSRLREKLLIIGGVFTLVFFGTFTLLYQGGMGWLMRDFTGRLPASIRPTDVNVVLIHPVEILAFEMKVAAILAAIAVVPLVCYYAWPAVLERGLAAGSRVVFKWWAIALGIGLLAGSVGGYLFVAPAMMAYLVTDAVQAGAVISYRAPSFFWLVFLASVGIGLLADVVITMVLFHVTGTVSYRTMRRRWREVTIALCCLGALLPQGIAVMLAIAIAVMAAYGLGLAVLWVISLGGRFDPAPAA
ncbi:twin-arginine translocase subunit TatC [Halosolutus gelatinilyticus]|uniref:twin-arginine translocase subunit TatC n=1 Tax=Halosolutus gelatinilyticus TaxID=2931975 RepID=UPI001FF5CAB5|nr:twin-arginine translocase subunit TatC [Halosolutus gelatinilyticus]